jgi:predicted ester cyclase/ketosteroid isomerase-like protein
MTPAETVSAFYTALCQGDRAGAEALMAPGFHWHVAHPVNDLDSTEAFFGDWWEPLRTALPDLEYRPFVRVCGHYDGAAMDGDGAAGDWVNATGYLVGTFDAPLFGIPATHRSLFLRLGELVRVADGKVAEGYIIPDFIDAMRQAGVCPLRPSVGARELILPPMAMDGLDHSSDRAESEATMQLVRDMIDGLLRFNGKSLYTMDQERFWSPGFMWYGPAGIGTSRGLDGFRAHHQGPFLKAFPKRGVDRTKSLVAEGPYVATGGWPHMTGSHLGGGWLGLPPSGKEVTMRVMDWWRREGDRLSENWVSIDILHVLDQFGLDVFAQMRALAGDRSGFIGPAGEDLGTSHG